MTYGASPQARRFDKQRPAASTGCPQCGRKVIYRTRVEIAPGVHQALCTPCAEKLKDVWKKRATPLPASACHLRAQRVGERPVCLDRVSWAEHPPSTGQTLTQPPLVPTLLVVLSPGSRIAAGVHLP